MDRRTKQPNTNGMVSAELTDPQRTCIQSLVEGNRLGEAAAAAGIDPSIVSAWLREPSFLAAYNAAQKEIYNSGVRQLRKLQDTALDVLEEALNGDDPKLAVNVALQVTRLNVAMGQPVGETDPEAIEIEQKRVQQRNALAGMAW